MIAISTRGQGGKRSWQYHFVISFHKDPWAGIDVVSQERKKRLNV